MSYIYKSVLALVASVSALSGLGFANDTSYAAIDVDSITTDTKLGSSMGFKGEEARKLMMVLPKIASTGGPEHDSHFSTLGIKSPGFEITMSCRDVKYSETKGAYVATTPECTFSFNKRADEVDTMPFKPEDMCK